MSSGRARGATRGAVAALVEADELDVDRLVVYRIVKESPE